MAESTYELELQQPLAASVASVYRAWTDAEELLRWWWPWAPEASVDLTTGGAYRLSCEHPEAGFIAVTGVFREIEPERKLVYTWNWEGEPRRDSLVRVEFAAAGDDACELRVHHAGLRTEADRENHIAGWSSCLDRLVAHVEPAPQAVQAADAEPVAASADEAGEVTEVQATQAEVETGRTEAD